MMEQLYFSDASMAWLCFFDGMDATQAAEFFPDDKSVPFSPKMADQLHAPVQPDAVQREQRDAD